MIWDRLNGLLFDRGQSVIVPYLGSIESVGRRCVVVEGILLFEGAEATFEIVDYGSRRVCVATVCADARAKIDVMVYYAWCCVGGVCEV